MCPTTLASIVSRGGGHSNNVGTKQRSSSSNNEAHHSAAVKLALPDIKMIKFDPDYDLHIRPNPQAEGQPIDVYFSVNLRNVLQVKRMIGETIELVSGTSYIFGSNTFPLLSFIKTIKLPNLLASIGQNIPDQCRKTFGIRQKVYRNRTL